jgi:hypothetical protein
MILLIDLQSPSIDGLVIALAKEICEKSKRVEEEVLRGLLELISSGRSRLNDVLDSDSNCQTLLA